MEPRNSTGIKSFINPQKSFINSQNKNLIQTASPRQKILKRERAISGRNLNQKVTKWKFAEEKAYQELDQARKDGHLIPTYLSFIQKNAFSPRVLKILTELITSIPLTSEEISTICLAIIKAPGATSKVVSSVIEKLGHCLILYEITKNNAQVPSQSQLEIYRIIILRNDVTHEIIKNILLNCTHISDQKKFLDLYKKILLLINSDLFKALEIFEHLIVLAKKMPDDDGGPLLETMVQACLRSPKHTQALLLEKIAISLIRSSRTHELLGVFNTVLQADEIPTPELLAKLAIYFQYLDEEVTLEKFEQIKKLANGNSIVLLKLYERIDYLDMKSFPKKFAEVLEGEDAVNNSPAILESLAGMLWRLDTDQCTPAFDKLFEKSENNPAVCMALARQIPFLPTTEHSAYAHKLFQILFQNKEHPENLLKVFLHFCLPLLETQKKHEYFLYLAKKNAADSEIIDSKIIPEIKSIVLWKELYEYASQYMPVPFQVYLMDLKKMMN